jgi:nucleoside 2-deoxyribosyltransferase
VSTGAPLVYVASPLGFTPAGLTWSREVLLPALRAAGLEPLDPWSTAAGAALGDALASGAGPDALREADDLVGAANVELIRAAAGVLAVLDGSDVDSGTAAEIGCASAWDRVVVGLRTDARRTGDNAGALVNLQIEHFITRTGGSVHTVVEAAVQELAALLAQPA